MITKDTKKKAKGDKKLISSYIFHKIWSPVNQLRNLRDLRGKVFFVQVIGGLPSKADFSSEKKVRCLSAPKSVIVSRSMPGVP